MLQRHKKVSMQLHSVRHCLQRHVPLRRILGLKQI
jgi:hypothetical protein